MKSYVRWVVLAAVVVLFSTNAWAVVWNPDTDPNLLFNMNFQIYDNGAHTTTDAIAALVGTVYDYNTTKPNIFGETSAPGLGVDANFATIHDICDGGAGWQDSAESANDVKIKISSGTSLFNLGTVNDTRTWAFWFNVPDLNQ